MDESDLQGVVQEKLAKTRRDLENLIRQREGVDARITQLQTIVAGLEYLAQEYKTEDSSNGIYIGNMARVVPVGTAIDTQDMAFMYRKDAVAQVLRKSREPMTIDQIAEALAAAGRKDTRNGISGALSRLKTERLARPYGPRGSWVWAARYGDDTGKELPLQSEEVAVD